MPQEPAVTVTGDEALAQQLREIQAKLEGAQTEIASLKVLLALRTHQHDQAWQAARRAAAELDRSRGPADAPTGARPAPPGSTIDESRADETMKAGADAVEAVARAEARTEAVRTVLGAVLASLRAWALDRRRFQSLIVEASRQAPAAGPGAERHAVLLAETRRVLGRTE